ncbi:MAG TPA: hypothetical protein VIC57_13505 [Candidatus Dormibacteraeota bacterium]|jgi:hypothetical protein
MTSPRGDDDFEPWLERELRQAVRSARGSRPSAEQAAYRALARPRASAGLRSARAAAAIAALALAVGGVTGVAAMTGGPSPMTLGNRVVQMVTACRDRAIAGTPGTQSSSPDVGRCVGALAGQRDVPSGTVPAGSDGQTRPTAPHGPRGSDPSPSPGHDGSALGGNGQGHDQDGDPQNGAGQNGNAQGAPSPPSRPSPPSPKPTRPPRSDEKHPTPNPTSG